MPSFRQVSARAPVLVIDAASSRIQVGALGADGRGRWYSSEEEAGVGVFEGIAAIGVAPGHVGTFVYCDGPGSVLGIRTVAMALRTWNVLQPRPTFAYCSLAIVAHALGRPDVAVIADARRNAWHEYRVGHGLRRALAEDLAGELVMPASFRHWAPLPGKVASAPYALESLLPKVWDVDLLHESAAPDAFLHEEPSYVEWTPQIHRAP
jgi:tRNA threonylcarbamoyladenosine biosynthesis protein TsaB